VCMHTVLVSENRGIPSLDLSHFTDALTTLAGLVATTAVDGLNVTANTEALSRLGNSLVRLSACSLPLSFFLSLSLSSSLSLSCSLSLSSSLSLSFSLSLSLSLSLSFSLSFSFSTL
jgi:hypothetical protein